MLGNWVAVHGVLASGVYDDGGNNVTIGDDAWHHQ
jgi:hypothetical protein